MPNYYKGELRVRRFVYISENEIQQPKRKNDLPTKYLLEHSDDICYIVYAKIGDKENFRIFVNCVDFIKNNKNYCIPEIA